VLSLAFISRTSCIGVTVSCPVYVSCDELVGMTVSCSVYLLFHELVGILCFHKVKH